jgi:GxxExxY protein
VEGTPELDALTGAIIDAIITVHKTLGPGLIESIYHRAMVIELTNRGLPLKTESEVTVGYDGQIVGRHRLDLSVGDRVLVERKTVEALSHAQYAQVRSYLRATGLPVALLVNFSKEHADYRRVRGNDPPTSPFKGRVIRTR